MASVGYGLLYTSGTIFCTTSCHVHRRLRVAPARVAGLADHVWSLEDIRSPLDLGMVTRAIPLVALAAFLLAGVVIADEAQKLSGSAVKEEDIVSKCTAVLVGTITKAGVLDQVGARPLPGPLYHGVEVKVSKVIRGSTSDQIFVTIQVSNIEHEAVPEVGDSYIFFLQKDSETRWVSYTALKLLPDTSANIATVKKLISN